jgi:hypothetical protein
MTIQQLPFRDDPNETPAQRTLRMLETDPEMLSEVALQLYMSESELDSSEATREYKALPESEKDNWRKFAINKQKEFSEMSPAEQRFHLRVSMGQLLRKNNERYERMKKEDE